MYLCRAYLSSTQIGLSLTLIPSRKGFYAYLSSIQTFVGVVQTLIKTEPTRLHGASHYIMRLRFRKIQSVN